MKESNHDWVLYLLIIVFIIVAIYLIMLLKVDAVDCLRDPILYAERSRDTICWCSDKLQLD